MTKIIPDKDLEKYIQATGWILGQKTPVRKPVNEPKKTQPASLSMVNIDEILKGNTFYSEKKEDGKYIGVAVALQEAFDFIGTDGYLASMPELIVAKLKADKSHDFWQKWYTVHTEENIGIDQKGRFYTANEPVLVVVNGGGILTPERIMKAYDEGLVSNSAKYEPKEFDNLLDGKLPDGSSIELFSFEDIKKGVSNLSHRFGVVMSYSTAQSTKSGWHKHKAFMENPLIIARAGGLENLESYYIMAKDSDGDLGLNGRTKREAKKMKEIAQNPNNHVVLFEIGGTYDLGNAVKSNPDIVYHPVHDKNKMLQAGLEVLLSKREEISHISGVPKIIGGDF